MTPELFEYDIHKLRELAWGIGVAALVHVAQVVATSDLETVTDWRAFGVSLAAGVARVAAARLLGGPSR